MNKTLRTRDPAGHTLRGLYVLDEAGNPVPEPDVLRWSEWYGTTDRHIAEETIGGVRVSTVFLGLDHAFLGRGPPVLWETMIFGGEHDGYQDRYTSRENALAGHAEAVALVRERSCAWRWASWGG